MSTFIACGYDIAWNFDHLRALALVPTRKRGAVAQLGERLNGIQEVDGSIPFGSTKSNHFRDKNLAQPGQSVISGVPSRVSSSASSSRQRRVSIHSHSRLHEEKKLPREGDDGSYESNLACRDRRAPRRADPDNCQMGADGPLPGAQG